MIEEWKDVAGLEDAYQISSLGRVSRKSRIIVSSRWRCLLNEKILTPSQSVRGYLKVCLRSKGKNIHRTVHKLVAEAFLKDAHFDGAEVNHIDHIKSNNTVSNLEWVTHAQNIAKAKDFGKWNSLTNPNRGPVGNIKMRRKLIPEQVASIRALSALGVSYKSIAETFHVTYATARRISLNTSWVIY